MTMITIPVRAAECLVSIYYVPGPGVQWFAGIVSLNPHINSKRKWILQLLLQNCCITNNPMSQLVKTATIYSHRSEGYLGVSGSCLGSAGVIGSAPLVCPLPGSRSLPGPILLRDGRGADHKWKHPRTPEFPLPSSFFFCQSKSHGQTQSHK